MNDSFIRTRLLLGDEQMHKLQKSKIMICGLGGVGSFAAESVARCGVGSLVLVDFDVVDRTNINRQLVALNSTIGKYKTDVMFERIMDINQIAL